MKPYKLLRTLSRYIIILLSSTLSLSSIGADIKRVSVKVPNEYIVVLKPEINAREVPNTARTMASSRSGKIKHTFQYALKGFSVQMTEEEIKKLAQDPSIDYIEENTTMRLTSVQVNPPWGLDRIDQRLLPLSNTYDNRSLTASAVNVYVIDSGIHTTHQDFGGRASVGVDLVGDGLSDALGHGTHVAGIIGGQTYGIAKQSHIYSVRVFGSVNEAGVDVVIAAVDWVTANRVLPAVANMSLGGDATTSLDTAVRNSIATGVTYVVSAGNESIDANNVSPARVSEAITVGATDSADAKASFSNTGSVVDLFAPGVNIASLGIASDTALQVMSGTSQAAPHVAGLAALHLQSDPGASPSTVQNAIVQTTTPNRISGLPTGTADRLAFNETRVQGSEYVVNLLSWNGYWVCAENGGGEGVYANRSEVGGWETFSLFDLNGGSLDNGDLVVMRSFSGKFLCAENGGGFPLVADRDGVGGWETFTIRRTSGSGSISAQTPITFQSFNGNYWSAENGGGGIVNVDRTEVGGWETFTVVY
jgi:subtilisin family serine protease